MAEKTFPPGWFDLSKEQYADFGAMFYLAGLTATHRHRQLFQALYAFETPLRLGQYHIFRQNGFPRAFVTFAGLSPDAEHRFAVEGQPLMAEDYTSGPSFWIVDLVSPFGQLRQILPLLRRDIPHDRVRANRLDSDLTTRRIVEWTRKPDGGVGMRVWRRRDFAAMLDMEA